MNVGTCYNCLYAYTHNDKINCHLMMPTPLVPTECNLWQAVTERNHVVEQYVDAQCDRRRNGGVEQCLITLT